MLFSGLRVCGAFNLLLKRGFDLRRHFAVTSVCFAHWAGQDDTMIAGSYGAEGFFGKAIWGCFPNNPVFSF
jgi:hypothetical protein